MNPCRGALVQLLDRVIERKDINMKKFKVYDMYLDDGKDGVFKVTVPTPNKKEASEFVSGNGEIVTIKENPLVQDIDIPYLVQVLTEARYGKAEIDVITRTLEMVGLDRY